MPGPLDGLVEKEDTAASSLKKQSRSKVFSFLTVWISILLQVTFEMSFSDP
jgi:hypothetical protein